MTRDGLVSPFKRPLGVTLYYASHVAAALFLALPVAALVSGTGVGRFPEGDRALFQPGGIVLVEVARALLPAGAAHASSSLGVGTLLGVLLLVPHTALLVSLSTNVREPQATTWGRAIGHLPTMLSLSGIAFFAQAIVFFVATTLAGWLKDAMGNATTRSADLAYLAAVGFGVLVTLALGLVRDLGRAAAVRDALGAKAALVSGLGAFARAPGRCLLGWLSPALAGVALVALAAALTTALDVSRPGAWRVWLVAGTHQLVAFALCFCRAFWLSASVEIVARESWSPVSRNLRDS